MKKKIFQKTKNLSSALIVLVMACGMAPAMAQPSGGPYGPNNPF